MSFYLKKKVIVILHDNKTHTITIDMVYFLSRSSSQLHFHSFFSLSLFHRISTYVDTQVVSNDNNVCLIIVLPNILTPLCRSPRERESTHTYFSFLSLLLPSKSCYRASRKREKINID